MKKEYSHPTIKILGYIKTSTKGKPDPGKSGRPTDTNGHSS